jgi:hypothetical protein
MKGRYLQLTFRRARPVAAYLYLPRAVGEKSARTVPMEHGLLVDYNGEDVPIGVEITAPERITVTTFDELLRKLGFDASEPDELAPLELLSRGRDYSARRAAPNASSTTG